MLSGSHGELAQSLSGNQCGGYAKHAHLKIMLALNHLVCRLVVSCALDVQFVARMGLHPQSTNLSPIVALTHAHRASRVLPHARLRGQERLLRV
jgi:hypothetical protein